MEIHDIELYEPSPSAYFYRNKNDAYIQFKIRPLKMEFTAIFGKKEHDYELVNITYHVPKKGGSYAENILDYEDEEAMNMIKNLIHHPTIRLRKIMKKTLA